jgi:hypothetical protein
VTAIGPIEYVIHRSDDGGFVVLRPDGQVAFALPEAYVEAMQTMHAMRVLRESLGGEKP